MSLCRLLFRNLRRSTAVATSQSLTPHLHPHQTPYSLLSLRYFAFSSAEEAAAERRRRKRRLRIEPPLHALRRDPSTPRPPPDPNAPRLPDSTSALVGPRLNLHNRVQSLIRAGDLDNASHIARQAVFSRIRPTVFTCNAITAAMFRAKRYDDSVALFDYFFKQSNIVPNVVSYNFLINTHCDCGRVDEALEIYRHILANAPFGPSSVTYRHLTKGLVDAGRIGEGVDLLREMLSKGHGADSLVYNNLIKGFLDLENLERANELFDELKERCLVFDGVVTATFMDWFFNQGREKDAMESYRSLLDREFRMTPVTCNVLLECLLRHGRKKDAWALFDSMLDNHTPPNFQAVNSETFSIMVNECFALGKFSEAVETFRKVGIKMNSKPFSMDVAGYNNMIVRFAEHGMIDEAEKFFEELRSKSLSPDVTGYRTLIDAYLKEKRIDDALEMFNRMVDANLRVISLYANRWFSELIENGKVLESSQLLTKMGEKDPKPDVQTYEVVIKGMCKIDAFDQCKEIIDQMMGHAVGITSSLREFLVETFEKMGQKDEIEKLLDTKRQVFGAHRQQPSAPSKPGSVVPRFPQSVAPSGPPKPYGHGERAGNAGSTYQYAAQTGPMRPQVQRDDPRFAGANAYESARYSPQSGSTGYPGANGHGGQTGYSGYGDQFASQTGPMRPQVQRDDPKFAGANAYESARYSPQSSSTGYPGANGHGGQTGYSGYSNQFASQTGPTRPQVQRDDPKVPGSNAYESARYSPQSGSAGYPGANGYGGQTGYSGYGDQFASQTGPMRPQVQRDDPKFAGANAYESSRYSPQSGSTGYPGGNGHGGQTGYGDQFASQTRQTWSSGQTDNARNQVAHAGYPNQYTGQGGSTSAPGYSGSANQYSYQSGPASHPGHLENATREEGNVECGRGGYSRSN